MKHAEVSYSFFHFCLLLFGHNVCAWVPVTERKGEGGRKGGREGILEGRGEKEGEKELEQIWT